MATAKTKTPKTRRGADDVPDDKKMLTTEQVATMLNVSTRKIYRLASAGKLKPVKFGWITRYRQADVERLMERGCR